MIFLGVKIWVVTITIISLQMYKFLYGLKQVSRQWYSKLFSTLSQQGYSHSAFIKKYTGSFILVEIYVDDILVTWNNTLEIINLKTFLHNQFQINDLGLLHLFLGIEFNKINGGMVVHQSKFIKELLHAYDVHVFMIHQLLPHHFPPNLNFYQSWIAHYQILPFIDK